MSKKKNKLIVIGAGGHAKSCIELIENQNKYSIYGIIDKSKKKNFMNYRIIGNDDDLYKFKSKVDNFVIGIGQIKDFLTRERFFKLGKKLNFKFPSIISKTAIISKKAFLGEGNTIFHNVIINSNVKIGENCIINNGSLIEHDCVIGNNTHVSTGVIINGNVNIGKNCFIGSGTVISNSINIPNNTFIKLGSKIY